MIFDSNLSEKLKNAYDIRATDLNNENVFLFGKAFGSFLIQNKKNKIAITYDRRKFSESFYESFIEGATSVGANIIKLGRYPTCFAQLGEVLLNCDASVSITASHNPANYHGIKFFFNQNSFSEKNLSNMVLSIIKKQFSINSKGSAQEYNLKDDYKKLIHSKIQIQGKFKIAWDFLNGVGADIFHDLDIKGTHYLINYNHDFEFGGHPPDPTYEARLDKIKNLLNNNQADFGVLLDGDCDRCVFILKNKLIEGDKLLALLAYFENKEKQRNIKTVWDTKSSYTLKNWTKSFSENLMSITGHSNIHKLAIKEDADIAGECSGHYMFKDFFYLNDGIYSALKFISYLEKFNMTLEQALNLIPQIWAGKEKQIICHNENEKHIILEKILSIIQKEGLTYDDSDGIKVFFINGWWMIRPSKTENLLRISTEGWQEEGLEEVKLHIKSTLSLINL